MLRKILRGLRKKRDRGRLPAAIRAERRRDHARLLRDDCGPERAVHEAVTWLARAQDDSRSRDGGVARHFSLVSGWSASYPETTGYIIPTLLDYAVQKSDPAIRARARRMLDWLVAIQMSCGGFQGGLVDSQPVVPVTFNTGQILLGLAAGVREFGDVYRDSMNRAAAWLVSTQDADGCWRRHPTPFAAPGEKAYETHTAWGLLEAGRLEPNKPYTQAALANVHWALTCQRPNGWFANCCLEDASQPLTHTLGYALRGVLEAYRVCRDHTLLQAAQKTAHGLLSAFQEDGFLPGRLNANWQGTVSWACLTGTAQVACCWLMLFQETALPQYRDAASLANRYLRRTVKIDGPGETRGAIKGSFPIDGDYATNKYLSWACKFFIDANRLEQELLSKRQG
jgi:hypothetical protein